MKKELRPTNQKTFFNKAISEQMPRYIKKAGASDMLQSLVVNKEPITARVEKDGGNKDSRD